MKKVYLAGQPNEYDGKWKDEFKKIPGFDFYDWEIHSNQASPETFFPDDLKGIYASDIMVANPSLKPSEATWIEVGVFYRNNVQNPGDFCKNLIIIWKEERNPKWSIEFVRKVGVVVDTFERAAEELNKFK
ncbi:MAG: hypothetical protein NTY66_03050 [Candidatus Vogelbacteria bacterium]|nr:hypothetical protein [Candidatus Vogelbacteria bacterium]